MTKEEALEILKENPACSKHYTPMRNVGFDKPYWMCEECIREEATNASIRYREKQDRIKKAAELVYGKPKKSFFQSFIDGGD